MSSDMPDADASRYVSVQRYNPFIHSHDNGDVPKYFPAGLTQYMLNNICKQSSQYYATKNDVSLGTAGLMRNVIACWKEQNK